MGAGTIMRLLLSAATLSLFALSCGPKRPASPLSPSAKVLHAPRVSEGALDVVHLLADVPERASRAGAGPVAIVAGGPMSEGDRLGAFVEVPLDACLLLYGRASPSLEDVDLAAFADDGSALVVDESSDRTPTLLLCPPHPARVFVAARAAIGAGLCVIGAQLVPKDQSTEVGAALGARGRSGGPPKAPDAWPGLDEHVRLHRVVLGGTWTEQRRVAIAVDARTVSTVAFNVEEGGCSDALVVPDDDVAVVDVDALDAEGRLVARAKDSGPARSVTVCSQTPISGSLQVRPHAGRGAVAVVLAKTKGAGRELLARPEIAWVAPSLSLEATRAARNATLAKAGYGAPSSSQSGQLRLGNRITLPVELVGAPNVCTRIDLVGGAPLALVEASVWDDAGALLATAEGVSDTTLFVCGRGRVRMDLATRGRGGPYSVLVRPERWRDASFSAHPLAAGRMLGRSAIAPGWIHEGGGASVRQASLDAVHKYVQNAIVSPSSCLRIAIGIEGEGTGLEARLFDAGTGDELDRSHGQTAASVVACADAAARPVRLELRATAGKVDAIVGERTTKTGD